MWDWKPALDITLYELAVAMPVLMRERNRDGYVNPLLIRQLPPSVARHFSRAPESPR